MWLRLTEDNSLRAAEADGDEREARRLRPAIERARARWLKANKRVVRGD